MKNYPDNLGETCNTIENAEHIVRLCNNYTANRNKSEYDTLKTNSYTKLLKNRKIPERNKTTTLTYNKSSSKNYCRFKNGLTQT